MTSIAQNLVQIPRPRRRSMSDRELTFRAHEADRVTRRAEKDSEDAPLYLIILGALTITGILPLIVCFLLFGFGLD